MAGVVGGGLAIGLLLLLPVVGVQLPTSWLDRKVEERTSAIWRDLPDTLDLMAISVEPGVGFDGALAVVCDNFTSPLYDDLARPLRQIPLVLPSRAALTTHTKPPEVPDFSPINLP